MGFQSSIEVVVLGSQAVIGQPQVFIRQRIKVSGLFHTCTRPRVFEHAFDDGGGDETVLQRASFELTVPVLVVKAEIDLAHLIHSKLALYLTEHGDL